MELILGSEYGEERWLTYTTLNKISIVYPTCVSIDVSVEVFHVVCPAIALFLFIRG